MSKQRFIVSLSPEEALQIVKERENADLIHEEYISVIPDKGVGTLIFEKYYFRVKNRVALVVIVDNLSGKTDVRTISTGSSQGIFLNFDWGAANDFSESVKNILQEYITEEITVEE